ncbi:MAG TPA: FAD-dependent oxidoreductase [Noviherbaspirillum sp.]|uniref:NAD(P)/FAD-dependent oxidoreductase n=1 Tax=Noviherbaspirillum sp. TaxID=1926288 RepID=UPI002D494140|nr:FAD-dependent oxidoreductase [Noviherbaspirillum sp.]HYD97222.1 FAD-dependent oxidoreductase [Noviherbaspirillum sp.]
MRHVIIGNGPAGVIAAETLRKHAPDHDIVLIGGETEQPYSRMAIPQLLAGHISETGTYLRRDRDYFSRLRVRMVAGRAEHVSSRTRTVKMEDGSAIEFDRLLIATGAAPRVPAIPGIGLPGVHPCWTLDDARRIARLAKPGARVVLIGAGFVGCIVMEALALRGVRLTVVERRDRMLPNMMGKGAGDMVQRWCAKKGIDVHTSSRVLAIGAGNPRDGGPLAVRLSNHMQIPADLVVYSVGTAPNVGFLKGSGIKCLQGVVVDASMQTNVPGVYAAGDCAESFDEASGRSLIAGVQPNAADQAYCAALNMTGRHAFQRGVRQIDVVDTLGLISSSFGNWQGVRGGQWVEMADERNFRYLRLEFCKDVLVGCTTVGVTEHATVLRSLIQHHVHLGEWKDRLLQDPMRLKEAYSACVEHQYIAQASAFHHAGARQPQQMRQAV